MRYPQTSDALALAVSSVLLTACGGSDDPPPAPPPAALKQTVACTDLKTGYQAAEGNVAITSSTAVAATADVPAHCSVTGTIRGNIKFAMYMPSQWNGKFQMVGNGGKAGTISLPAMAEALKQGYATSSTDTGHDAASPTEGGARFGNDALFGKEREIDFGYRAVHVTALTSKDIIKAHYPDNLQFSYWNGCSTGGRQGLMELQNFPDDFDGYVVGAPVYNYVGQQLAAPAALQPLYKNGITGGSIISPAKRDMIGNIVYNGNGTNFAGCDAKDGLVDGQIRNPLTCDFNPAVHVPACDGTNAAACLTATELNALQEVYAGKPPFTLRLPFGSENTPGGWMSWIIPNSGLPQLHPVMVDAFQWLMFDPDRPNFNYLTDFNWATDPFQMEGAKLLYNATNPDLRAQMKAGKKIIMYHGWGDPGANPLRSIEYRNNVVNTIKDPEAVDKFYKLFMIPGLAHCSGGQGHTTVDFMGPITKWVEQGQAPQQLIGSKTGSTRPHCAYPQEAVYNGTGDQNVAANYTCKLPL